MGQTQGTAYEACDGLNHRGGMAPSLFPARGGGGTGDYAADKRTALYGFRHYAKMVSFAGWEMPMNYEAGIKAEHLICSCPSLEEWQEAAE